ncbi:MAG: hypothetical protein E7478_08085 [Ruminococcaceae bacterium]|nr:hypothetical protein [Oscillospiraceae bacterium]
MAIGLKEATYCSEKGYIDRAEDIREIMEHLTRLTLRELNDHCNYNCLECFDVGMQMLDIPTSYLNDLSYIEMLCVMDSIRFDYWKYDSKGLTRMANSREQSDAVCRLFYVYTIAKALSLASRTCTWVKLFFAVSVKAYVEFITSQAGCSDGFLEYKSLCTIADKVNIEVTDTLTVGAFIGKALDAMNISWNAMQDIDEYAKQMYTAYEMVDSLLLHRIQPAYPKQFDLAQIRRNAITFEKIKQAQTSIERSM